MQYVCQTQVELTSALSLVVFAWTEPQNEVSEILAGFFWQDGLQEINIHLLAY